MEPPRTTACLPYARRDTENVTRSRLNPPQEANITGTDMVIAPFHLAAAPTGLLVQFLDPLTVNPPILPTVSLVLTLPPPQLAISTTAQSPATLP